MSAPVSSGSSQSSIAERSAWTVDFFAQKPHCLSLIGYVPCRCSKILHWMWHSRILETIGSNDIGLWLVGMDFSPSLRIGTTIDNFQPQGTEPDWIEILNSFVREEAMLHDVPFSILAEIPSGPLLLDTSRFCRSCKISPPVDKQLSRTAILSKVSWESSERSGGTEWLKFPRSAHLAC